MFVILGKAGISNYIMGRHRWSRFSGVILNMRMGCERYVGETYRH